MTKSLSMITASVVFALILTCHSALGQVRTTFAPPGYVLEWGSNGSGTGQFANPFGIATDNFGNVFVADTNNHRIQKFDNEGNYITQWGSNGAAAGQFSAPTDVATDGSGNVYVADSNNNRIQMFDGIGNFINLWGSAGTAPGKFLTPSGVTVDPSGNVFVADKQNNRIQKFSGGGAYLGQWGTSGTGPGSFNQPNGLVSDHSGNIYVADTGNNRIQEFDGDGIYLTGWGAAGSGEGEFSSPAYVAVGPAGNILVVDSLNARIQAFDSVGNFITMWGTFGGGPGEFQLPAAAALDTAGNVFVADNINHRIQKFAVSLWVDLAGTDAYLSVRALNPTDEVRTLFQLENGGAPRFAFRNTSSGIEWSFQQSGPGNFLISKEGTGGPEMQVFQNGRVRMGAGGAAKFDLDPNGNLVITGSLTAKGSVFPDYVFEPDYELMPLSDLRTFIEQEHKLPRLPSAKEVEQQGGHNMTELQIKLLEKIEELTLYTLEQDLQLQARAAEIDSLKSALEKVDQLEADLAQLRALLANR